MKKTLTAAIIVLLSVAAFTNIYARVHTGKISITGKEVTYILNGKSFKGYVAYNEAVKGKRPGILVVHEWWGCNSYARMRARKLAELGYIAFAVDMYGDGKIATTPQEAQEFSGGLYKDMDLLKSRMQAAEDKLKSYPQTNKNNIAAIGYCFGGSVVMNAAKLGMDFKGVVSFHGGLAGVVPDKKLLKSKMLVCHGGDDKFSTAEDVTKFKKQMDSVGANYTFKVYPGASHAFSNPEATALGKKFNLPIAYNEAADKNSWSDMKVFFSTLFTK